MKHRAIFIEGLPGTGKTTISEKLYELLIKQGIQAELLQEGDRIPSNLYNIAGIPKYDFNKNIDFILQTENYFFVDLGNCTKEETDLLQVYNLGDAFNQNISAQEYAACTLEWWQHWVENNIKESILILDSAFLQCPINEMAYRKASDAEIKEYIQSIAEIIRPFSPFCIYMRRKSAEISMTFAKSVKSEQWANRVDKFLADIDCLDVFERRYELESELVSLISNVVCDIDGHDWSDVDKKVQELYG